jgi:hypothetical protein
MPSIFCCKMRVLHTLDTAHFQVEVALEGIVDVDDLPEVGPRQLSPQCGDNLPKARADVSSGFGREGTLPAVDARAGDFVWAFDGRRSRSR